MRAALLLRAGAQQGIAQGGRCGRFFCFGDRQGEHFHSSPEPAVAGVVGLKAAQTGQFARAEDPVNKVHDRGGGTPGGAQRTAAGLKVVLQPVSGSGEQVRIGASEAIDGLLAVAHQKDTAAA